MYYMLIIKHSKNAENKRIKVTQKPHPKGCPAYIYLYKIMSMLFLYRELCTGMPHSNKYQVWL